MKLVSVYSESHRVFKDKWFLPSIKDDYELHLHFCPTNGQGRFMEDDWVKAIKFKAEVIIQSIKDFRGETFVYSDIDVQFFLPTQPIIEEALKNNDIVCQLNRPWGTLCTGFFAMKANKVTSSLWERVYKAIEQERRDQLALNRFIRSLSGIRYQELPKSFFGGGTFSKTRWMPGDTLFMPSRPVMHHANCTVGVQNKILQLQLAKTLVSNLRISSSST